MNIQNQRKAAYGYLLVTFILWGSLFVVSKYVLGKLPTFTISFLRFVIAFVTLSLIRKKSSVRIETKDVPYLFLIGVGGYFIAVGAQLLGTKYAGASLASLLNALNPITMTVFAAVFLHEKLTAKKVAGLILALIGVYVILGGQGSGNGTGIAFSLFAVLFWSAISVLMRKVTQKYDSLQVTRYGIGIAALCYLPVSICEAVSGGAFRFDIPCVLSLLYMGAMCTGVAYFLWNKSLSVLEAGTCSAFYPVQPLVSAALGMLLLKEQTGMAFWIGSVLIAVGIYLNLAGASPEPTPEPGTS